jgi:CheY-like chemotaxis protein
VTAPARESGASQPLVLVVDDEPQLVRFLRATLPSHGYRLAEATTGHQALVEASTRGPDLVLLDLGLPDLDGSEVTRRIRGWRRCRTWSSRRGARSATRWKRSTPGPTTT